MRGDLVAASGGSFELGGLHGRGALEVVASLLGVGLEVFVEASENGTGLALEGRERKRL